MKIIKTSKAIQKEVEALRLKGKTIAVVPTMGYLHEGHLSLIKIARKKCDIVILTIFVNPTQFGAGEDFDKYPRDLRKDTALAVSEKVDYLFAPEIKDMYPVGYQTFVLNTILSGKLEGEYRPEHFKGVTTVVAKLFNLVKPHVAVFGQKDYQQAAIIKRMTADLNFDVKIIIAPIIREKSGLAMSSRNVYLSESEKNEALSLRKSLDLCASMIKEGETDVSRISKSMQRLINKNQSAKIDYVKIVDSRTLEAIKKLSKGIEAVALLAVRIGKTRLIDNRVFKI